MARKTETKIKDYLLTHILDKPTNLPGRLVRILLFILSCVYSFILGLRLYFYKYGILKSHKMQAKVISVGNMTLGGTGKTPLVEAIIRYLIIKKQKAAVITRGYMGFETEQGDILADEPKMLKDAFPEICVIINKDRIKAVETAQEKSGVNVAVLDDALGNLKIHKDLDFVCIDTTNPFGSGYLLPRGILRLPFCYLQNADIFVLTHCDLGKDNIGSVENIIRKYNKTALICKSRHKPVSLYDFRLKKTYDLSVIKGKCVALLCAIAKPENFDKIVQGQGARVEVRSFFCDHHNYKSEDLEHLFTQCRKHNITSVITTAKDESKLELILKDKYPEFEVLSLNIKLEIYEKEAEIFNRISGVLAA